MSSVFSYDEGVAGSAGDDIAAVANGLEASLNDLGGFVARVKQNWTGDEAVIYEGIQQQFDNAAATVKDILNSVRGALGQTTSSVGEMRGQVRGALQG